MKDKPKALKNSKNIKIGQFYKTNPENGYYYIGCKFGKEKVIVCLNMEQDEVERLSDEDKNPVLSNSYIKLWGLVETTQEEVLKNIT